MECTRRTARVGNEKNTIYHIYEIKITTTNEAGLRQAGAASGHGNAVQGLWLCKRSLHCFPSSSVTSSLSLSLSLFLLLSLSNHIHMQNESNNTMAESNDANTERDIITTTTTGTTTRGRETGTGGRISRRQEATITRELRASKCAMKIN